MHGLISYMVEIRGELLHHAVRHIELVIVALAFAIAIGVPAGILAAHRPRGARAVIAIANVFQTIPSLAAFGILIPMPLIGGIGARPAMAALAVYALLPVVKNTITGIHSIDPATRDAAMAMGMTRWQIVSRVELPLAVPVILAGIRIAAVISVGTATIAAAIGAGGLGVLIFRGLETLNNHALLAGALSAALLALAVDATLAVIERALTARSASVSARPDV
ncbi:MAG TPA: ABC transporter permease [Kofleriaceae bacterium]|nr:ABC transporter permease [Kofleriaceae bacterium]